eukprot:1014920-Ditylum_brightwellii.AAC.1
MEKRKDANSEDKKKAKKKKVLEWDILAMNKPNALLIQIGQIYDEYSTEYDFLEGYEETLCMIEGSNQEKESELHENIHQTKGNLEKIRKTLSAAVASYDLMGPYNKVFLKEDLYKPRDLFAVRDQKDNICGGITSNQPAKVCTNTRA